ncbi:MAG: hypothetical protein HYU97_08360 [Deltaproteobacteria bacterium]|nr:hypothetical protein [Deltaproteobacteria bacterium]
MLELRLMPGQTTAKRVETKHVVFNFDRTKFVQELLSLGLKAITPKVAKKICQEVELHLQSYQATSITSELISNVVRFKLEEMGIIPYRPQKTKVTRIPPLKKEAPRQIPEPEEPTVVAAVWNEDAALEKLVELPDKKETPEVNEPIILPPKVSLSLPERSRHYLEKQILDETHASSLETTFYKLAEKISGGDELTALTFYNLMATGEFFPHLSVFKSKDHKPMLNPLWGQVTGELVESLHHIQNAIELLQNKVEFSIFLNLEDEASPPDRSANFHWLKIFDSTASPFPSGPHQVVFPIDHPEIEDFIRLISTTPFEKVKPQFALSSEFLQAVAADTFFALKRPSSGKTVKLIPARKIYDELVNLAKSQVTSIGVLFLDNLPPEFHAIPAYMVSPGFTLYSGLSMGALNLFKAIEGQEINWQKLRRMIHASVQFLDNLVDVAMVGLANFASLEANLQQNRSIALAPVGLADLLIELEIPYGSERALELTDQLMDFIRLEALEASRALAEKKGPYLGWNPDNKGKPLRNQNILAMVESPEWSKILGIEGGMQPLQTLTLQEGSHQEEKLFSIYPPLAKACYEQNVFTPELVSQLQRENSIQGIVGITSDIKEIFVTRQDIGVDALLKSFEVIAKYCDYSWGLSVSFPSTCQTQALRQILARAYLGKLDRLEFKIAIPEDFELEETEIATVAEVTAPIKTPQSLPTFLSYVRPTLLEGYTLHLPSTEQEFYVTLNLLDKELKEILAHTSEVEDHFGPNQLNAFTQLINLILEEGLDLKKILERLSASESKVSFFAKQLNKTLEQFLNQDPVTKHWALKTAPPPTTHTYQEVSFGTYRYKTWLCTACQTPHYARISNS